jgi:hypothetical protein
MVLGLMSGNHQALSFSPPKQITRLLNAGERTPRPNALRAGRISSSPYIEQAGDCGACPRQ